MRFSKKDNYFRCTIRSNLTHALLGIEFSNQPCTSVQVGEISPDTNEVININHELAIEQVKLAVCEKCLEYNIELYVKSILISKKNLVPRSQEIGFFYGIAKLIVDRMQLFPDCYDGEWNGVDKV